MNGTYKVCIRRNLAKVKPEAEQIDGKSFYFVHGWEIPPAESSIYAGEVAMIPHDNSYPANAPAWIASGDLK